MKAMILAAGKGTRMLPLTADRPKALIEVQGIPLLEHTIRYLHYHGIEEIIINVHHHAEQIVDFVTRKNAFGLNIAFSDERDELLDTGGGLYKARWFFNDNQPFVLTSSDVITNLDLKQLCDFHDRHQPLATLAVSRRSSTRDFLFDAQDQLCGWHHRATGQERIVRPVENPRRLAFSTIHVLQPAIFDHITERGRFSIVDAYLRLAKTHPILGFEHSESLWFECGRIENLEKLNATDAILKIYSEIRRTK